MVQLPSLSECLPVAVPPDVVERAQHILPIGRILVRPKEPQAPVPIRVNQLVDLPPKVFIDWVHDAATLPEQTTFQDLLHGPPTIQHTMDEHPPALNLVNNPIGFEVDLPIAAYTDRLEFRWAVASTGHWGQAFAGLLELSQNMLGPVTTVGSQDIPIDVKDILLGLRDHKHLILHGRFFVRAARSANAFLSGLCLPASILRWLWASNLSRARLSCVCS